MKTTWEDINKPECEKQEHKKFLGTSEHGKSTVKIICPFCTDHIHAYIWSLQGCGKRCHCGALHGAYGETYKMKVKK